MRLRRSTLFFSLHSHSVKTCRVFNRDDNFGNQFWKDVAGKVGTGKKKCDGENRQKIFAFLRVCETRLLRWSVWHLWGLIIQSIPQHLQQNRKFSILMQDYELNGETTHQVKKVWFLSQCKTNDKPKLFRAILSKNTTKKLTKKLWCGVRTCRENQTLLVGWLRQVWQHNL